MVFILKSGFRVSCRNTRIHKEHKAKWRLAGHQFCFRVFSSFGCSCRRSPQGIISVFFALSLALHVLLHIIQESLLLCSSFPPAWHLHFQPPLPSIFTILPLHLSKLSQPCLAISLNNLSWAVHVIYSFLILSSKGSSFEATPRQPIKRTKRKKAQADAADAPTSVNGTKDGEPDFEDGG